MDGDFADRLRELREQQIEQNAWWGEAWRWKDEAKARFEKLEEGMNGIRTTLASQAAEMRAQVRLSSFLGSIAGGVLVGLILWAIKGGP